MFRRALALPLCGIRSALLNMTMWEDLGLHKKSDTVQRAMESHPQILRYGSTDIRNLHF
jgi:hypothetical protein